MDIHDKLKGVNELRDKLNTHDVYLASSKARLLNTIRKKLMTSFIGSIDIFEKMFGSYWGKGKQYSDLTVEEKRLLKLWQETRNLILNNGNNQVRTLQNILNEYTINKEKNVYNISIRNKEPNNE